MIISATVIIAAAIAEANPIILLSLILTLCFILADLSSYNMVKMKYNGLKYSITGGTMNRNKSHHRMYDWCLRYFT